MKLIPAEELLKFRGYNHKEINLTGGWILVPDGAGALKMFVEHQDTDERVWINEDDIWFENPPFRSLGGETQ